MKKKTKWLNLIDAYGVLEEKFLERTKSLTISHKVTEPIILVFSSDWHIGSPYTNHHMLFSDLEELLEYPSDRVRLFLVGDLIDNFPQNFRSAEAPANTYISPELQRELLKEIIGEILPYVDASTWGNHDVEFDEKNKGFSDVAQFLKSKIPFFHGKGFVVYRIGDTKYNLHVSHNLKGSSVYHDLQGPIRAWVETHSDIIVGGHHHSPSILTDFRGQDEEGKIKQRVFMKLGTYKVGRDTYSDRYFKSGVPGNNVLVLFPDEKKILPFLEFGDAVKYLGLKKTKSVSAPKKVVKKKSKPSLKKTKKQSSKKKK